MDQEPYITESTDGPRIVYHRVYEKMDSESYITEYTKETPCGLAPLAESRWMVSDGGFGGKPSETLLRKLSETVLYLNP